MKRILICDDEPHMVEGVRHLLRGEGRVIETANTGKEALVVIDKAVPDLVITDIMMPEMSGLELVAKLREGPSTKHLPVIILTAKGQAADATVAEEVWGATVVAKPFEPRRLRALVASMLEDGKCPASCST